MRRAVATVALICLPLYVAAADIYRSVDAQGHVQYSDTPSPGAQRMTGADLSDTPPADNPPADTGKSGSPSTSGDPISEQLARQAAARAVQQDTAQTHAQQCKQAQDTYQQSIDAHRLYKTGPNGERQYLNDDEAEQQRVNYQLAMQAACKSSS